MFEIRKLADDAVKLRGRLDASQADLALEQLRAYSGSLTADFSELEYISSAGLGVIVATYKRLAESGHTLRLMNLQPKIRNLFHYSGLDQVLLIE
jgi:anti-sigma B factor antagonist